MATEPYQTSISTSYMEKISNWLNQQRAGGKKVEPWQLEASLKAGLAAEADRASGNYFRGKELKLREQGQASDQAYREEALKTGEKAGLMNLAGNVGTTALMYNLLKKPNPANVVPGAATGTGVGTTGSAAGIDAASGLSEADLAAMTAENATAGGVATGTETAATAGGGPALGEAIAVGSEAGTGLYGMAGGVGATPAFMYTGPAVAGYVAPKLLDTIHGDSTENIGHNLTLGLVKDEGTAKDVGSGLTGAAAGAGAGFLIGGPPGALIGAGIGGLAGVVGSKCIIVTACTSPNSEEVNIAREYRDKFLDQEQLRGYYWLAEKIVPILEANETARRMVKKWLVTRLADYGTVVLGKKEKMDLRSSWLVARLFLALCRTVGMIIPRYMRQNGEVY